MLLPGHIAGGYLATRIFLSLAHPSLTADQTSILLWIGTFAGILPDFDWLRTFWNSKSLKPEHAEVHRRYFTHIPFFWLVLCGGVYMIAPTPFIRDIAVVIFLGTWSHMAFDSLEYGVMWLWPFNTKLYALFKYRPQVNWAHRSFWNYWFTVVVSFSKELPWTFYGEIFVSLVGLAVFLSK